jgi:hypothetical protein
MNKNNTLLFDPPHILPPDVVLTSKCENCGDAVGSPYYVMIGIPPSPLMIASFQCESVEEEKEIGKSIMNTIQYDANISDRESKYQWIFSEQNIMSSKMRVCNQCFGECTHPHGLNVLLRFGNILYRIRIVKFAVKEHQRRHTPIESSMSDYEKYIISLPDRTKIDWDPFGEVSDDNYDWVYFDEAMRENLKIALIPDYKSENESRDTGALLQEFRTNFIQDKNRLIPNDQELTRWMMKKINGYDKKIQYCKIFSNPKKHEIPFLDQIDKIKYPPTYTKYTVVVHYSIPKGDWEEYDI